MDRTTKGIHIIRSIFEAIVGILLLIDPIGFTSTIITVVGIIVLLLGISSIVKYFRTEPEMAIAEQSMTYGLLEVIFGLFCIIQSKWLIAAVSIITVIYGIGMLIFGIAKVQFVADMIRLKVKKWIWAAISAVLMILCGVIILCNPFGSTVALWTFTAVVLIAEAIVDVIVVIFAK